MGTQTLVDWDTAPIIRITLSSNPKREKDIYLIQGHKTSGEKPESKFKTVIKC